MLSYYAGVAAHPNMSLSAMLVELATWIIREIEHASLYSKKLHVANPVCPDDVFTDRRPESITQQSEFASHLRELVRTVSVGLPDSAYTNRELGAAPAAGRFLNYSKSTKVQSFADAITGTKRSQSLNSTNRTTPGRKCATWARARASGPPARLPTTVTARLG